MENSEKCEELLRAENRIRYIKIQIVNKLFNEGMDWNEDWYGVMDDKGNISKSDEKMMQEKKLTILGIYHSMIDLVWDENWDEDICSQCAEELEQEAVREEAKETIEQIDEELKKKGKDK